MSRRRLSDSGLSSGLGAFLVCDVVFVQKESQSLGVQPSGLGFCAQEAVDISVHQSVGVVEHDGCECLKEISVGGVVFAQVRHPSEVPYAFDGFVEADAVDAEVELAAVLQVEGDIVADSLVQVPYLCKRDNRAVQRCYFFGILF